MSPGPEEQDNAEKKGVMSSRKEDGRTTRNVRATDKSRGRQA